MADTTHGQPGKSLAALTDQCVMCGLCLPHCPTYGLDQHEAESPRGRIAVARRLASGQLPVSAETVAHLDRCLACLACEAVCPSQVEYEEILIQTRALLKPSRPPGGRLSRWLADPAILVRLARLGSALRAGYWLPPLARCLPGSSRLRRLAAEMPRTPAHVPLPLHSAPVTADRGRVILFPGCVASVFDRDTLDAARILLGALGHDVAMPTAPVCCGALALHAGEVEAAARSAQATHAALQACDAETVLVCASGCLGSLRDHGMPGSALRIDDVLAFLAADVRWPRLRFKALPQRVAVHLPCTQMHVGSGKQPLLQLLASIPGLQLLVLPDQPGCCGAAGNYFIEQADHADRLRAEKLDQFGRQSADLLLTTNIGCRIFLGNGLRQRDARVAVLHPLTLLARQLETAP